MVGLVGNTGNARYTPSHLHFGVYTNKAAGDPLPFVNRAVKTAPAVPEKNLALPLKLLKTRKNSDGTLVKANTVLAPVAVTAKGYIAELPDGNLIQAPFAAVQPIKQPEKRPDAVAAAQARATKGS